MHTPDRNPEQTPNYEMLHRAEAYVMAAYGVIANLNNSVAGVSFTRDPETFRLESVMPYGNVMVRGEDGNRFIITTRNKTHFDVIAFQQSTINRGENRLHTLERWEDRDNGTQIYHGTGIRFSPETKQYLPHTPTRISKDEARDWIVTLNSDFRAALSKALADKPQVLQQINEAAENIYANELGSKSTMLARSLGYFTLHDQD